MNLGVILLLLSPQREVKLEQCWDRHLPVDDLELAGHAFKSLESKLVRAVPLAHDAPHEHALVHVQSTAPPDSQQLIHVCKRGEGCWFTLAGLPGARGIPRSSPASDTPIAPSSPRFIPSEGLALAAPPPPAPPLPAALARFLKCQRLCCGKKGGEGLELKHSDGKT